MVNFFEVELGNARAGRFEKAMHDFAPKWNESGLEFTQEHITYSDLEALYSRIDSTTFKAIWAMCLTEEIGPVQREYLSVCSQAGGAYQQYLKEVGEHNEYILRYQQRLESSGDFNNYGQFLQGIWMKKDDYNFGDPDIQIFIAIHIITINDQHLRNKIIEESQNP